LKFSGKKNSLAFQLVEMDMDPDPDPDPPGSGAFLTPGSGIRNRFFPDPGSRIPKLNF
jgi:hypothetical protein